MPRKMEVQDYNPEWEREYLLEKNRLQHVLKEVAIKIHHIGSTAIPGIKAKPIIDILIEVTSIDELDELTKEMKELGYEAKGENGIKGRRYFQKGEKQGLIMYIAIWKKMRKLEGISCSGTT